MFVQPKDREVVCHASAWDVDLNNDLRIKMCIKINQEDLITIHHELGHNYYYHYYYKLPVLFQNGAHDGFHEAIGDALALSVTPAYLKQIGLITEVPADDKGLINLQMQDALDKIAFLPFGKLIDQWRWDVFSGKTKPEDYNAAWWALRAKYQGIAPAGDRPDPRLLRRRRQVPRPRQRPLHPLLPGPHPPIPVPQGPVRRPPATPARSTTARSTARPPPATSCEPCSRSAAASPGPKPSRSSPARAKWTPSR
jgi:hypothetical protein